MRRHRSQFSEISTQLAISHQLLYLIGDTLHLLIRLKNKSKGKTQMAKVKNPTISSRVPSGPQFCVLTSGYIFAFCDLPFDFALPECPAPSPLPRPVIVGDVGG